MDRVYKTSSDVHVTNKNNMKAAQYYGREDIRIEEIEETPVSPTDVAVEVEACGICGTDLHEYSVGPDATPGDEPDPVTGKTLPLPLGHEFSGTVIAVGEDVANLEIGQGVVVNPNVPCRECVYCEEGTYNLCSNLSSIGYTYGTGGFSEKVVAPASQIHPFPENVPLEYGALVEPLSVGLHAVRESEVQMGDTVAVFGCGPIGIAVIWAANKAGAKTIFASELQDLRRERALELGANIAMDPTEDEVVDYIHDRTPDGVDVAFDFAGVGPTLKAAIESTRKSGSIVIGAVAEAEIPIDTNKFVFSERSLNGTYCYGFPPVSDRTEFDAVIQFLAENPEGIEPYVSNRISLDDIVKKGFEPLQSGRSSAVKVLVNP